MASELDWERHDESLGGLLDGYFESSEVQAKMGAGHRAGLAWHSVIGDIERKHTTGVFAGKPRHPGDAPALCVYVDNRMRMVDFNANREIYLARLQARGFEYSEVRFLQNKRPLPKRKATAGSEGRATGGSVPAPFSPATEALPELTPEELDAIARETADLPEGLSQSVSKAMVASMRRQKAQGR